MLWVLTFLTQDGVSTHYIIDRISPRKKMEKSVSQVFLVSPQSASFQRLCVDLADVDLAAICPEFVGIGKHVCGAATDLSLRCPATNPRASLQAKAVIIALCCHHRCTWQTYVGQPSLTLGKAWLRQVGLATHFTALCQLTSWVAAPPRADPELAALGRKAKYLIDFGRLTWLQSHGFSADLFEYVADTVTKENLLLSAIRVQQRSS